MILSILIFVISANPVATAPGSDSIPVWQIRALPTELAGPW